VEGSFGVKSLRDEKVELVVGGGGMTLVGEDGLM